MKNNLILVFLLLLVFTAGCSVSGPAADMVLSDCTSSKTPEIQESNLRDMANVGAVIASSKEIIKGSERA